MPKIEKPEIMEGIKTHLSEQFADFIVIGIDVVGDVGSVYNVGIKGEKSKSNHERIMRMVGELENIKLELLLEDVEVKEDEGDDDKSWE